MTQDDGLYGRRGTGRTAAALAERAPPIPQLQRRLDILQRILCRRKRGPYARYVRGCCHCVNSSEACKAKIERRVSKQLMGSPAPDAGAEYRTKG